MVVLGVAVVKVVVAAKAEVAALAEMVVEMEAVTVAEMEADWAVVMEVVHNSDISSLGHCFHGSNKNTVQSSSRQVRK